MNIGEKIKEIRLAKGMKQSDLAEKAGISRVAIGNYERGDRQPNIDILSKIATALDLDISDLVPSGQLRKRGYPIRWSPEKVQNAILTSLKQGDSLYDINENDFMVDVQILFQEAFDEELGNLLTKKNYNKELIAGIFRLVMVGLGFNNIVHMHDNDILKMFYSDEFKSFMNLLILKYNTSTKDSDN